MRTSLKFAVAALCTTLVISAQSGRADEPGLSTDMQSKIDHLPADLVKAIDPALPTAPVVKPAKPRKLLVYMESKGYYHDSIPICGLVLKKLGEKTGAWTATITDDPAVWTPETLAKYDAVFMDNTVTENPKTPEARKALLDYVKAGHGFGGSHAGADCNHSWDEYFELIGGEFGGHPWGHVSVKNEDPKNPINAAFDGQGFVIDEEIYTYKMVTANRPQAYSRDKLHILYSVDLEKSGYKDTTRTDGDYGLAWIHKYGEGHVFYTALGHNQKVFVNPILLKHFLAGIQYSLGDLEADATPTAKMSPAPTVVPGPDKGAKTINVQ